MHNRLTECWNQGNVALLEELLAPDFIHHDPDRPDIRSREDYKRWFAEGHSLFWLDVLGVRAQPWRGDV